MPAPTIAPIPKETAAHRLIELRLIIAAINNIARKMLFREIMLRLPCVHSFRL
jgi:hypothetical protein